MGIRKHFEKKPNEDLKLQDLTLEQEKTPELKFDPETEITEADWQGMKQVLEVKRRNRKIWSFTFLTMVMKILRPVKFDELNIDDQAWRGMKENLETNRNYDWRTFNSQAANMKILQPERFSELGINDQSWQNMKEALEALQDYNYFAVQAVDMKILQPNKFSELSIDDKVWQKMKAQLEIDRNEGNWGRFTELAKSMKILQPKRFSELRISNQSWREMRKELELERKNNWWNFAHQAMDMKILAADKVKVTDQGLEITMPPPESFKSEKKPRPERKNF